MPTIIEMVELNVPTSLSSFGLSSAEMFIAPCSSLLMVKSLDTVVLEAKIKYIRCILKLSLADVATLTFGGARLYNHLPSSIDQTKNIAEFIRGLPTNIFS